jgi:hypothetical protein
MLDNLRNQSAFEPEKDPPADAPPPPPLHGHRKTLDQLTGMSARQRFLLALMLSLMVCLLGFVLLLLTGKIVLPI